MLVFSFEYEKDVFAFLVREFELYPKLNEFILSYTIAGTFHIAKQIFD